MAWESDGKWIGNSLEMMLSLMGNSFKHGGFSIAMFHCRRVTMVVSTLHVFPSFLDTSKGDWIVKSLALEVTQKSLGSEWCLLAQPIHTQPTRNEVLEPNMFVFGGIVKHCEARFITIDFL